MTVNMNNNFDIRVWEVHKGKIQSIYVNGYILQLRGDVENPIQVAKNFFNTFEIEEVEGGVSDDVGLRPNEILIKPETPSTDREEIKEETIEKSEKSEESEESEGIYTRHDGKAIGKIKNVKIYDDYFQQLVEQLPSKFYVQDIIKAFDNIFPEVRDSTKSNRAYAYAQFMRKEGYANVVSQEKGSKMMKLTEKTYREFNLSRGVKQKQEQKQQKQEDEGSSHEVVETSKSSSSLVDEILTNDEYRDRAGYKYLADVNQARA